MDVRDIASAFPLAFEKEEAAGNRYIVSEGPYKWQDFGASCNRFTLSDID